MTHFETDSEASERNFDHNYGALKRKREVYRLDKNDKFQ